MFILDYNYANTKLAKKAIRCVEGCRTTGKKDLRVKDIIEMNYPGLYRKLSRGDKCRVGRVVSTMFNLGRLPHLSRGIKKGATNTYHI